MHATVVILTKLPGHLPIKTRLWSVLGEAGTRSLYLDMLGKAVALAHHVRLCSFEMERDDQNKNV